MPNCFSLTRKGETKPTDLKALDEELCKHFGDPIHPVYWYYDWHNMIGWNLAVSGMNWEQMRALYWRLWQEDVMYRGPNPYWSGLLKVLDYLEANFVSDAWYQVGK